MSLCQGLQPVYIVFIFCLGFFIFSHAPFHFEAGEQENLLAEKDSSSAAQSKLRQKRSASEEFPTHEEVSANSESLLSNNDNENLSIQKRRSKKVTKLLVIPTKTKTGKPSIAQLHKSAIDEMKRQNETRVTVEILKTKIMPRPEKASNDSISIVIKKQPFHFHIPILSGKPISLPPFADLLAVALRYKQPLTLDVAPENPKTPSESHKSNKRQVEVEGREQENRIARNSPVLDFLDIDKMLQKEIATIGKGDKRHISAVEDKDRVDGVKRSIEKVTPTAEILQQLIGDKDDLEILLQDKGQRKTRSDTVLTSLEIDIDNALKRRKRQHIRQHDREKRGLGKWLKNIFHKKTTTTTTTTEKPKPRRKSKTNSNKQIKNAKHPFRNVEEIHKDTNVDLLLPNYLRTSAYYKRKAATQDYMEISSGSSSSSEENSRERVEQSRQTTKKHHKNQKRFKRGIFDDLPYFQFPNQKQAGSQFFPFAQPMSAFSSNPFTGNHMFGQIFKRSFGSLDESPLPPPYRPIIQQEPITSMSKEEMKIINEIFSNIINEKCYPVNSQVLEVLQYTMSSLIDKSQWPEISSPNIPQVDYFLQKVVNCSSDAVNIMAWKSQRSKLMSSNSQDIEHVEQGHPLLRTKRISDFDIQMERQKQIALRNNGDNNINIPQENSGQIEKNQLQKLISLMTTLVSDACINIEPFLLSSTEKLIDRTIDNTYSLMKITVETMTSKEANELIDSFTKCSSFSSAKQFNQNKNYFSHKATDALPILLQPNTNYNSQNLPPMSNQNNMNYWDRIPYYLQTIGLPKPSPIAPPPLQNPEKMNNYQQQNVAQQGRSTNKFPVNSFSSYSYSSSSSSNSNDGRLQPNNHNVQNGMQSYYSDVSPPAFNRAKRNTFDHSMSLNVPILYNTPPQEPYQQNNANYY